MGAERLHGTMPPCRCWPGADGNGADAKRHVSRISALPTDRAWSRSCATTGRQYLISAQGVGRTILAYDRAQHGLRPAALLTGDPRSMPFRHGNVIGPASKRELIRRFQGGLRFSRIHPMDQRASHRYRRSFWCCGWQRSSPRCRAPTCGKTPAPRLDARHGERAPHLRRRPRVTETRTWPSPTRLW